MALSTVPGTKTTWFFKFKNWIDEIKERLSTIDAQVVPWGIKWKNMLKHREKKEKLYRNMRINIPMLENRSIGKICSKIKNKDIDGRDNN